MHVEDPQFFWRINPKIIEILKNGTIKLISLNKSHCIYKVITTC